MHNAYFSNQAKSDSVQTGVFAAKGPAERFSLDDEGQVRRSVQSRDSDAPAFESIVGPVISPSGGDLRAAADLAWLCRKTIPEQCHGAPIRVVDLFSGCGAMSLGVSEACRALGYRFESAGAFDIDVQALRVYERLFGLQQQSTVDLARALQNQLDSATSDAESKMVHEVGSVDMVLAGPPCQGHSTLNNRTRHTDPKNELYFLVARYAKLVNPKWVIIENVPTVQSDRSGVVRRTADALEALGYWVISGVVDLGAIGVAQTRRRHVLVAQREELGALAGLEDLVDSYRTRPRALSWVIEDLLDVRASDGVDAVKMPDPVTQTRIDYLFDQNLFDLPDHMRPDCHRKKSHTYQSVYGRMSWHEPAPTITSGFDTMGRGRFVHPKRRRTITAHEAARLQFIPDFVDFSQVKERTILSRLIGNAVPPKLSYVIGLELMR
jgi:DNA (cytosine-5)-methyltransferase 1